MSKSLSNLRSWPLQDTAYRLISVGMPAFNCEKTLATAIRSLLHQTYDNWELLLMEDGSSDGTLDVALSFFDPRISVISDRTHKGLVPRLNQAVAMSRGAYFARMDADDVAYPERLERQTTYLEGHPEIDLLGCGMLVFKGDGVAIGYRPAPETHEHICRRPLNGFPIGHPTWMGRTAWFRAHPYDARAMRAEDQVLLLKTYKESRFACLSEILCGYREDKLALRKILRSRYGFAKAAVGDCLQGDGFLKAVWGILLLQCGKALADSLAVATGLRYELLRHRARPLGTVELLRWAGVWSELKDETESVSLDKALINF